ncbi:MAG: hypothetical protein ABIL68_08965 [bacterium]
MKCRVLLFIFFLFGALESSAQEEILPTRHHSYLFTNACVQMWGIEESRFPVSQASFPLTLFLPLSSRLQLTISHVPAYVWWTPGYHFGGLSDTWVQGNFVFWKEKMMINLGVGVPTGKTRLSNPEFLLTKDWLSRNIFQFQIPVLGQGLCSRGGVAFSIPVGGDVILGLGGQYLYRMPFHPVKYTYYVADELKVSDKEYKPGDEVSGHIGLDVRLSENMKIMLDGMYTYYWRDLQGGQEVYGSGGKINAYLGFFYRWNKDYFWAQVTYRRRGKNEVLQGISLRQEETNTNGDQIETDIIFKVLDFEEGGLMLLGDARYNGKVEGSDGVEAILGGGVRVDYRLAQNLFMVFHIKYLFGWYRSLAHQNEIMSTNGMDALLGFQWQL